MFCKGLSIFVHLSQQIVSKQCVYSFLDCIIFVLVSLICTYKTVMFCFEFHEKVKRSERSTTPLEQYTELKL